MTKPAADNRGWWISAAGLLVLMAWCASRMVKGAAVPNGYLGRHWDVAVDGPWVFRADVVRTWVLVMVVEGLAGIWWLRKRSTTSLGVRSLAFGLLMLLGLVLMSPFGMHASAPLPQYFGWTVLASAWSIVFAAGWRLERWFARKRARRLPTR